MSEHATLLVEHKSDTGLYKRMYKVKILGVVMMACATLRIALPHASMAKFDGGLRHAERTVLATQGALDLNPLTEDKRSDRSMQSNTRDNFSLPQEWHKGWSTPLYLPELKTLLCTHPKAGCSTIRNLVLQWSGDFAHPHWTAHFVLFQEASFNHSFIEKVSEPDRAAALFSDPSVLSVAFVREPISRLVSMFTNKMISGKDSDLHSGKPHKLDPTRRVPVFMRKDLLHEHYGFKKFIRVLHLYQKDLQSCRWEEHIDLQSCRCGHRYVQYDFLGRAENLTAGLQHWLTSIGRPELMPRSSNNSSKVNKSNHTIAETLYASLDEEDLQLLWDVYGEDYTRFGYDFPPPFLTQFASKSIS
jgi:hypothetical protein